MGKKLSNMIDLLFSIGEPVDPEDKYQDKCKSLADELCERIYPNVSIGATLAEPEQDGTKICLTNHGEAHVITVMSRALDLLRDNIKLTPYETYILVKAILIHDIGNIYGRQNHELNSQKAANLINQKIGKDKLEIECITSIAWAHGGKPKDKISMLYDETLFNNYVHKRRLAAILKFADELADDRSRCSDFQMKQNLLPANAIIFHKYSFCLHSVLVSHESNSIQMAFDLDEEDTQKSFEKNGKKVLLVDEIYERTFKTHLERLYCMRFLRPAINIDKIKVTIKIRLKDISEYGQPEFHIISYEIGEVGYPEESYENIFKICPELKNETGEKLKKMLSGESPTCCNTK